MPNSAPKTPAASAPTKSTLFYAPILRYGEIVEARVEDKRVAFKYAKLGAAIDSVKQSKEDYENAVIDHLRADGWTVETPNAENGLARFRVNRRLGAVIDFDELLISRGSESHIIRFCVTVCVDTRGELSDINDGACERESDNICFLSGGSKVRLFSKIWVRVSCLEYGTDETADVLSMDQLSKFRDDFEDVSRSVIEKIKPVYIHSLSELVGAKESDISVNPKHSISNFTVSIEDDGFRDAYNAATFNDLSWLDENQKRGKPIAESVSSSMRALKNAFERTDVDAPMHLTKFDNAGFGRALYWTQNSAKTMRMFGFAHDPFEKAADFKDPKSYGKLKGAPSNSLGVVATSKFASRV